MAIAFITLEKETATPEWETLKYYKKILQVSIPNDTFANRFLIHFKSFRRGARVVMEQIANLSTGNRCRGSNPRLSATIKRWPSGCSVARLSRLLWEQEVAGSNPATPTKQNPFEHRSKGFFGF